VPVPTACRNRGDGQFYSKSVRLKGHSNDLICTSWPEDWILLLWAHCGGTTAVTTRDFFPGPLLSHWSNHRSTLLHSLWVFLLPPALRSST